MCSGFPAEDQLVQRTPRHLQLEILLAYPALRMRVADQTAWWCIPLGVASSVLSFGSTHYRTCAAMLAGCTAEYVRPHPVGP